MDKIEEYLEKQRKVILEDREETLISLGLFEKEYSPNGKYHYQYKEYDLADGEKRYYRKKALPVTEEQWAEIVSLHEKTSEIQARKEQEREKRSKYSVSVPTKKWIPVFVKNEEGREGKSQIAKVIRVIAIVFAILGGCIGVIEIFDEFFVGIVMLTGVVVSVLLLLAVSEILSYSAELLAIAREGVKFSESYNNK